MKREYGRRERKTEGKEEEEVEREKGKGERECDGRGERKKYIEKEGTFLPIIKCSTHTHTHTHTPSLQTYIGAFSLWGCLRLWTHNEAQNEGSDWTDSEMMS